MFDKSLENFKLWKQTSFHSSENFIQIKFCLTLSYGPFDTAYKDKANSSYRALVINFNVTSLLGWWLTSHSQLRCFSRVKFPKRNHCEITIWMWKHVWKATKRYITLAVKLKPKKIKTGWFFRLSPMKDFSKRWRASLNHFCNWYVVFYVQLKSVGY